jgi:hypothetical protein
MGKLFKRKIKLFFAIPLRRKNIFGKIRKLFRKLKEIN